ncbi:excisionase family DNA-binding protein [Actinotalea lenta]|uniref:excisionase family DNA-binding protein n=1 Tax=Actinotalea lenta TaxID=3064654 RepID=UPI003312FAF7
MTPKEVAERLGIPEWWVREQIRRGRVPHLRFGRHRIALLSEHVDAIHRAGDRGARGVPGRRRGRWRSVRLERACARRTECCVRLRVRRPDGTAPDRAVRAGASASAARAGRRALLVTSRGRWSAKQSFSLALPTRETPLRPR